MKKAGVLLIFLLLVNIIALSLVLAQDPVDVAEDIEEKVKESEEKTEETIQKIETKWDYLGKEWQNWLRKNPFISALDSFFTKISIVFRILFGMSYSLSITLFVIILIWLFFFFWFAKIFQAFSIFEESTYLLVSLAFVIILAQMKLFLSITTVLGWIVFAQKGIFFNIIMILLTLVLFFLIYKFRNPIAKFIEEAEERKRLMREKAEKQAEKIKEEAARKAIIGAFKR